MTILLHTLAYGKNKRVLQDALNGPHRMICFMDPSIFAGSRGIFAATDMRVGEEFPCVMDPATRMRFSTVKRVSETVWRVS